MSKTLNYQDMVLRLLEYWKEHGCLVWNPYNVQVGAGTNNPATALRVLGPEPWNIVYVEPSVRPDDGRFGENPNRMQIFNQLQVIIQPDRGNSQELYLGSLEAIGLSQREHDIRFVEDNWASPVLGAWGLGWEVWLDGQEISQFTYFQQAGTINLDPVAVELTYGLDRIALALQDVNSVWELDFGVGVQYEQVLFSQEVEHCEYYFNTADVEALKAVYDTYDAEARRCIEAGLVIPAHDYNLKCSHLFNVLDTRGAVGVTERAQYFRRMRDLARQISQLYVAQRESLGFPFKNNKLWQELAQVPTPPSIENPKSKIQNPATFVLEIGSEELPAGEVTSAINQLQNTIPQLLTDLRLTHGDIAVHGTPRRLAVIVQDLAPRQTDLETEAKGPPADRAFDADGNPTKAAMGFARGKGVDVGDLRIVEDGKRRYVVATVREEGQPTVDVLAEALPDVVAGLKFEKSMRWNHTNIAYSRPLRYLVALFGDVVVLFEYAGAYAGRVSRGLLPYGTPDIRIDNAASYTKLMAAHGIVIEVDKRRSIISANAKQLAVEKGGRIPDDPDLLEEVTNLVERPTPLIGAFEERYLRLPPAVLIAVMKKHQRYFPVLDGEGNLLPYFIAVRNGDAEHLDKVQHGNEHVIRARFADAEFFYNNDTKQSLTDFLPELDRLTFQAKLGSMLDKTERLMKLVPAVSAMLDLTDEEKISATRSAAIAKADLATQMVVEMTSLQGIMGGHYAQLSGEPDEVAEAIAEQYEAVSGSRPGLALALADRLDSLAGLFSVGLAPKGSNDPFALRRAAIHIVENLIANEVSFDLREVLEIADGLLPVPAGSGGQANVLGFITGRLDALLREQGFSSYVVKAVLAEQAHNPYLAQQTASALQTATQADDWMMLLDSYARCVRITRKETTQYELNPSAFADPAEQQLYSAYQQASNQQDGSMPTFVASLRQMEPAITRFFDDVMVMAEDHAVRYNRLALLQHIANLTSGLADLSQLEGF